MAQQKAPLTGGYTDPATMSMGQLTEPAPAPAAAPYDPKNPAGTEDNKPTALPKPGTPTANPTPSLDPTGVLPQQMPVPIVNHPPPGLPMPGSGLTDVSSFSPQSNLIGAQIAPGQTDRMGIARDYFNQFAEATNPAYEHAIRTATQHAAANGRMGSGMLTTDYGNLADNRTRNLDLMQRGLLTDATQASIGDAQNNRHELRTERGYQNDQSQQAIQNAIQQILLQMNIGNAQLNYGESGNPANILLGAGSRAGANASDTGAASADAFREWAYSQSHGVG